MMTVTEAIYAKGVLKPVSPLDLPEHQRVRLVVEVLDKPEERDRSAALEEVMRDIEESTLHLAGPLPSRDELHDRF